MAIDFKDGFESGSTLAALGYASIIDTANTTAVGVGGTWAATTTGTQSERYFGEFTKGSLSADAGGYGFAEGVFDQAFDDESALGFYAIEMRRSGTWMVSLYHGLGANRDNLRIDINDAAASTGSASAVITPNTFQTLRLEWQQATFSNGISNFNGTATAYVDGVSVIALTGLNISFFGQALWNQVVFGPMGHLDNIWIVDTRQTTVPDHAGGGGMPDVALNISSILGRNGIDPPQDLPNDMAVDVVNLDFYKGACGQKRLGASAVTLNGFSAGGVIGSLHRYLPSDDETIAELWATDSGALTTAQRLALGTTWAAVTLADAIQANEAETDMVSFNGKLMMAYNSAVNRTHLYTTPGGSHRRAGLAVPAVPTTGAPAGGTVTDNRKYAVCWVIQSGGVTVVRSNLSPLTAAVTLAAQLVVITRPALAAEGETHWELYIYSDDDNYAIGRLRVTTAVGTSTVTDDTSDLSSFTTAPPLGGANTPFPSVKFLITEGSHLIGAGAWETAAGTGFAPSPRLVCWTPALGTSDTDGDDERIVNTTDTKNFLYVDQGITGLGGPLFGGVYVFAYRQVYKLVPTGQADSAYNRITLRTDIGCIRHKTIVLAEDESGQPALFWLSHRGPYRAGVGGIEYIGRDVQDRWDVVNLAATSVVGWGMYLPEKGQIHWYVATDTSQNDPDERWVYDVRLGRVIEFNNLKTLHYGWARHTGVATESRCGVLFANTLGAAMTRDLRPYLGRVGTGITVPTLWKGETGTTDAGTAYSASMKTKAHSLKRGQSMRMLNDAFLIAQASAGVTLTLTVDRDFGTETRAFTASIGASGSETRVFPKVEGASIAEAGFVQFQVGDAAAADNTWILDGIVTPLQIEGPL